MASKLCLMAAGVFLLFGMVSGIFKYAYIMRSPKHRAPVYIDIAHRSAFLYSFAALVLGRLSEQSIYGERINLMAALVPLTFFALTIAGYFVTGLRDQTENLFSERNALTTWFMYLLIAGEIGGTLVLLAGYASSIF